VNLKFRLALLFTLIVAFIQAITCFSIYYFYADHRKVDYQTKLKSEALLAYDAYLNESFFKNDTTNVLPAGFNNKVMYNRIVLIYSENKKPVALLPNNAKIDLLNNDFEKIKKSNEYYFIKGEREYLGIYLKEKKQYIITSAIDIEGLAKLSNLKLILIIVFFSSILLAAFCSYFFVNSALKPLKILIEEIQQTTERSLWKKVNEGNGKDEIAKIAINYNNVLGRLKNAFETQQIFVQQASHELRTPLTVMYATTESALNKKHSEQEYIDVLESLKEEQINLIELTNSLLVLYQLDKHKKHHNWHWLRIDELLYDAVSYCKKIFPGISIDFSFENLPEEQNLSVKGNESLIKACFINLIKNAFLYSDDKKLNIVFEALDDSLQIHFDNRGTHLTQHEIEILKKPFERSEDIGLVKGIGLGLSIVEKVLTFHNGHLLYTAMPNSVNRFTVKLK
jgi:signal transduction histidine kinase